MFKLDNKIGLGLASLGRPGYINIGHSSDLGSDISKNSMRSHCHEVLSHAYKRGIRYFDAARYMEMLRNFYLVGLELKNNLMVLWGLSGAMNI